MDVRDGTLVLGALNGDRFAFAELYDRRARLVRAICYDETRNSQTAADLAQEVFLRAYKNLRRLHEPEKFAAWLVGITRQVCREWRRKQRREERAVSTLAARRAQARGWDEPPDARLLELRELIAGRGGELQESLTPRERTALHAFYLQGRSVEDARGVLGCSRASFYRVLSSACARLRRMLGGGEVGAPDGVLPRFRDAADRASNEAERDADSHDCPEVSS